MYQRCVCVAALFLVALLSSCNTIKGGIGAFDPADPEYQSVRTLIDDPKFRAENQPVRTLRVAVLMNDASLEHFARGVFQDASDHFEQQVGIRLQVTFHRGPAWETRSFFPIHSTLREFRAEHPEYDLVFGVALTHDNDERPCLFGSCFIGMIDDGRNIALLTLSRQVILHEIGHAFLGIWHSPSGIMLPVPEGEYFTVANREEILRNKWQDFRH